MTGSHEVSLPSLSSTTYQSACITMIYFCLIVVLEAFFMPGGIDCVSKHPKHQKSYLIFPQQYIKIRSINLQLNEIFKIVIS